MQVTVHYFAQVRDRLKRSHDQLTTSAQATPHDILTAVVALHPHEHSLISRCRVAVDHAFINDAVTLSETSEIALIPPVSGG
jgi:sulfur-carrier protein